MSKILKKLQNLPPEIALLVLLFLFALWFIAKKKPHFAASMVRVVLFFICSSAWFYINKIAKWLCDTLLLDTGIGYFFIDAATNDDTFLQNLVQILCWLGYGGGLFLISWSEWRHWFRKKDPDSIV